MEKLKDIQQFVLDNLSKSAKVLSEDIFRLFNVKYTVEGIRTMKHRLRKNGGISVEKEVPVEEQIMADRQKMRQHKVQTDSNKKYTALLEQIDNLEQQLAASLDIKEGIEPVVFEYKPLTNDTESVAFAIASDWHIEEEVKSDSTNGLNRYNLKIAESCSKQFFQNTLKLVEKERNSTKIDTLVLALLGDFITGRLHEENLETCRLQCVDASIFAENLLISGIQYLLDNSDLNLIIPCHVGNHSRVTKKVHFATENGNSLEYIMYHHIKNHFKDNTRINIMISPAYLSYLDVFGFTVCFQHGHGIRYGGAYGGITTSVVKATRIWEQSRHADLYIFGHHHTQFDGDFFIANGSMIGYGARSLAMQYAYAPRKQSFFLINKKYRCKTVVCPLLFEH